MTSLHDLQALDGPTAAPFDFAAFEQRRAARRHRNRTAGWSAAAALGMVAIVSALAVLTRHQPATQVLASPAGAMRPAVEVFQQPPALVDMDRFLVTSELEDHIALLDAEISAARLRPVPGEQLRGLESTRAQLKESLQRVAQAHALLDL